MKVSQQGGAPFPLASETLTPGMLAVGPDDVVWIGNESTGTQVNRVSKIGSGFTVLARGLGEGREIHADQARVYFVDEPSDPLFGNVGRVHEVPLGGGPDSVLYEGVTPADGAYLAPNGGVIYSVGNTKDGPGVFSVTTQ
jgi:hypothetical protein